MDNIKNFLGNVMTTGQSTANPSRYPPTGVAQSSTGTSFVPNVDLKNANVQAAMGKGRSRTDSESSVASDISSVSMSEMGASGRNQQMNKRKDSEPYFWIMWHS